MGAPRAAYRPPASWDVVVAAAQAQAQTLAGVALRVDAVGAATPSRIEGWRVHDLLVHLTTSLTRVTRAAREPGARVRQVTLAEYSRLTATEAAAVRRQVAEDARGVPSEHSGALLAQAAGRLSRTLAAVEADKIVVMRCGTLPLSELLALHCLETLGHLGDVAAAAGVPVSRLHDPHVVALATHLLGGGLLMHRPEPAGGPHAPDRPDDPLRHLGRLCPAAA